MSASLRRTVGVLAVIVILMLASPRDRLLASPILRALYDPADGNITMQAFENGEPVNTLGIATFQLLSPAAYLSGSAAAIPPAGLNFATVLNTGTSTVVDPPSIHSEIYATNLAGPTPLFTGSWNLGNVAVAGLTQADILTGFTTDPTIISPSLPGGFLYQVQGGSFAFGEITAVPEPSSMILAASAGVVGGLWTWQRRRRARRQDG
jgi:hypothetical protein